MGAPGGTASRAGSDPRQSGGWLTSTSHWGELAFPSRTTFAGLDLTAYEWTYIAPAACEQSADRIDPGDDGQGPADGNITGVNACTNCGSSRWA